MADMNIVVGATDAATPVLRRVRGESDRLGESLRRAAQASGKIGGSIGGLGGRVLGGAAMGGGMGMAVGGAALGLTALTTVLSAIRAQSERQVAIAQRSLQLQQSMQDIQRNAQRAREQVAAGGLSMVTQARQLRTVGGGGTASRLMSMGVEAGDAMAAASMIGSTGRNVDIDSVAMLTQTGFFSAAEAAQGLATGQTAEALLTQKLGGNRGRAQIALEGTSVSRQRAAGREIDRRATIARVAGRTDPEQAAMAEQIEAQRAGATRLSAVDAAVVEQNRIPAAQLEDLLRGRTEDAIRRQSNDALDGGSARAMEDLRRQTERSAEALRVAYEAQTAMGRLLNEAGGVISGSSRSAALDDFQRSAAVINR